MSRLWIKYNTHMRVLTITVKANARRESVQEDAPAVFTIQVPQPALKGKANKAMLKVLARHLGVRENQLLLTKGDSTPQKTVLVLDES